MVVCFFPLLLFQFLSALPTTWRNLDQFWSLWVFSTSSQATYSHCTITISIFCSGKFFCFLLLACRLLDAPPPLVNYLCIPSHSQDVDDCCCVNPGTLTKGESGGTYARMNITMQKQPAQNGSIIENIAAQVIRI